jgi:hypothetical protein
MHVNCFVIFNTIFSKNLFIIFSSLLYIISFQFVRNIQREMEPKLTENMEHSTNYGYEGNDDEEQDGLNENGAGSSHAS